VLFWLVEAWKAYAHRAGSYQTRVLLTFTYVLVLGPGAVVARMFGTRLLDVDSNAGTTWLKRDLQPKTLDALRRQF
jgi:hypothetical protein